MKLGYIVLGLIVGGMVAGSGGILVGMVGGAFFGVLLARISGLEFRIKQLESDDRKAAHGDAGSWNPAKPEQQPESIPSWEKEPSSDLVESTSSPEPAPQKTPDPWQASKPERAPARPSLLQKALKNSYSWLSTGNVPVKIGIIVTFIGVSFLLKYAIDKELLVFPIEARLLAVAAAGLALMVIGWRLREKVRVYGLSLQGGGAGILFLTVFAAFRLFDLLPASVAFIVLLALTFATGALAVLQNSRWLAILGMTGGFLAPILTSTGQGSHIALFSYYLVLNCAILGISWFRAWRSLNLLGFLFTFFIGSFWGYQYYKPELISSTMPFLILHFLLYQAVAILFALRQLPERLGLVDGALVFGTPAIVFALQSQLMANTEYGLAISAVVVAVFYGLTAVILRNKKGDDLKLLTESYIALAVAFATLAIPLAFDARWTSAAWALEGAALVWIGVRQERHLANLTGTVLIFLGGLSFMEFGWKSGRGIPILNGNVMGGVLISLSSFFASNKLRIFVRTFDGQKFDRFYWLGAAVLFVWAATWWLGTGFMETIDRQTRFNDAHVYMMFMSLSMVAALWTANTLNWSRMRNLTLAFLPLAFVPALFVWSEDQHFLFGLGWLAWPVAWLVQGMSLKVVDGYETPKAEAWHFVSVLLLCLMLALEAFWLIDRQASGVWALTVALAIPGLIAMLIWRLRSSPSWPVPFHPAAYLNASVILVFAQVLCFTAASIADPGDPAPWPYIPLFNPFDLAMAFSIWVTILSVRAIENAESKRLFIQTVPYKWVLAALFFIMTTNALVRGVHHYAGIAWNGDALVSSVIVQTSLSIYWGLLGFIGMIFGARRSRRPLWLIGAGFMALVVIKLFVIDLGNTGTVERIVSFMGIGALLLVVGYFAPAPPRSSQQ